MLYDWFILFIYNWWYSFIYINCNYGGKIKMVTNIKNKNHHKEYVVSRQKFYELKLNKLDLKHDNLQNIQTQLHKLAIVCQRKKNHGWHRIDLRWSKKTMRKLQRKSDSRAKTQGNKVGIYSGVKFPLDN